MEREHPAISIRRQCELLGVNRSGLYYHPLGESEENLQLMRLLDEQYTRTPFYGSRKITEWLRTKGFAVNRKRVSRLMKLIGIEAIYPKPKLSQAGEGHKIYPYLLRGVGVERADQVWSTDITYIRMAQGFVYLVAVMDWFSRYVLSWQLSLTMELDFCVEALRSALRRGRPEIFNSDQGSQFTSEKFTGELEANQIAISMDGRGRCMDNIFIERLWRSLKYEEVVCCERRIEADSTVLYRRWRMTLRSWPAGAGSKPPQAAGVKSPGGERCGKRRKQFRQVWLKETNVSEPLMTCRNVSNRRRNRDLDFYPASKGWERPAYCPTGVRHEGGVNLGRASVRNTGTCRSDVKGETQAVQHRKGLSTDAEHRGGDACIRDEGPVMGLDRRGIVIRFLSNGQPAWG